MDSHIEIIGDCTLYLGDCREIMPYLHGIDCIITDPVWPNCPEDLIPGWENPCQLFADFCQLIPYSLRQLVVALRNDSDPRFLRTIPERLPFQQVAWLQYTIPGHMGRLLSGNECAYAFGRPVKSQPGRHIIPSLAPKAQPSDRPQNGHPCSRAIVHQEWLVNWFSEQTETVLDPFMGSGTTAEACIRKGRKFVGIEIEPQYFDIACRRVERSQRQPDQMVMEAIV